MIEYIKGEIVELTPARMVLECAGICYELNISLNTYTFYNGKTLKIWDADVLEEAVPTDAVPGQVLQADKHGFTVAAGEGILKINELQLEGKKRMAADALLRGFTITPGEILGERE